MQFWGFRVLMILLSVSFMFILVAMLTNNWWMREDIGMNAGLWEKCNDDTACGSYGTRFDRSLRKLAKLNVNSTLSKRKDKIEGKSDLINTIRGLTVFSLVVVGIATFISGIFVYLLTSKTTKRISRWPQLLAALVIVLAAVTSFSSVMCATNHEKIFGITGMKLGGSWVAMLIGSLMIFVTGVIFIAFLIRDIYNERVAKPCTTASGLDNIFASKQSSRKNSKVSMDHSTINGINTYPPYGSLQQFNVNGSSQIDGSGMNVDENENDYKIPDIHEIQTSFHQSPIHSPTGLPEINLDSDITIGKLNDFSSDPKTVIDVADDEQTEDSGNLTNQKRSTSFENILYTKDGE